MKRIGIVMTIHNRGAHTKQSLEYLERTIFPNDVEPLIIIIDDCSTEEDCIDAMDNFDMPDVPILRMRNSKCEGVKKSLQRGINLAFTSGCTLVTNLDNDVKLKPDWLTALVKLHDDYPGYVYTAFHSLTMNRHKVKVIGDGYCIKESVGGINLMFDEQRYLQYIKPALQMDTGNWDHESCKLNPSGIFCTVPSRIQHTGIVVSSMNHTAEEPDVAADYFQLELPSVTLVGVDTNHYEYLLRAAEISQREIKFGAVIMLRPEGVHSKEDYNRFIVKELYKHIHTEHALTIQWDGYVINPEAWRSHWLSLDFIGATWLYKDGYNVGNSGFCLRSRRLLEIVAKDNHITQFYPEDHQICRQYRPYLEDEYGLQWATEDEANRFSIEAYGVDKMEGANRYSDQFGFHGWRVDFTGATSCIHVPRNPIPSPYIRQRRRR